jgi:hypothetical protein
LAFTSNGISQLPEELLVSVPALEELHILEKNISSFPSKNYFFMVASTLSTFLFVLQMASFKIKEISLR